MSLGAEYRQWNISPTWSGSLGLGPVGAVHARYILTGQGLVASAGPPGWRAQRGTMGGRVPLASVHPGYQPPAAVAVADPDPANFTLTFTGGGPSHGLSAGASLSTPWNASDTTQFWTPQASRTARSLVGSGWTLDISANVIGGAGVQLLLIPAVGRVVLSPMGIIGTVITVADLIDAIRSGRIRRLRELFPCAALVVGSSYGVSAGLTAYEGIWSVSER